MNEPKKQKARVPERAHVSNETRRLNPHLYPELQPLAIERFVKEEKKRAGGLAKPRGRKGMNKTETAFSHLLEARQRRGDIVSYDREGMTLRWPDGMTYTADFSVVEEVALASLAGRPAAQRITLIEVKGAYIHEDALVKFRAARAHWPLFGFEMHQLAGGAWTRLL